LNINTKNTNPKKLKSEKKDKYRNTLTERKKEEKERYKHAPREGEKERVTDLKTMKKKKDTKYKSNHISSCKFIVYFTRKNLLFLFYTTHKPRDRERKKRQL